MIRICTSLQNNGYKVTLVGTRYKKANALTAQPYSQKRISLFFSKGPLFYITYNIQLFIFLIFNPAHLYCAIDLDTILPVFARTFFTPKKRIYDAHEYFSQQKEVISRPHIYKLWHGLEKFIVPRFKQGYTVSQSIANQFSLLYDVQYAVVRNVPLRQQKTQTQITQKNIIYQGAVNEARCFETLIPAMKHVNATLHIYGDGNFMGQTKQLIIKNNLTTKVILEGKFAPSQLKNITATGYIGVNLVEHAGLSQYYSLANKFFDYIQHSIPQLTMNYPEYKQLNDTYNIALLINDTTEAAIANGLNTLLNDDTLYKTLQTNCAVAAAILNWGNEEKILLAFYNNLI